MKVSQIVDVLERLVPPSLAAEWDNVGLLVGDADAVAGKLLLCIDLTGAVLKEARRLRAQMVMAYHPVIFKSLARVTAADSPIVYAAVRQGLAVYSMHTALDAAVGGTNDVLAELLGMTARRSLEPSARKQCKLVVFVPPGDLSGVAEAAFSAGAGRIGNYYDCAFFSHGVGAFCGSPGTHPGIGQPGRHEAAEELRLEVVVPGSQAAAVCRAVRAAHSYEEPAIDVYPMEEYPDGCGMGRIGKLSRPATLQTIVARLKKATGLKKLHLVDGGKVGRISVAACCAGSCGDTWRRAAAAGAQLYVTGEMRHHDALAAAAAGVSVVCLGHSNSERVALASLAGRITEATRGLKVAVSRADADPFEIV